MSNGYHPETLSSTTPLISNKYGDELSSIRRNNDNHTIDSNRNSLHRKSNSVHSCFEKTIEKFDSLNVETHGIGRILPEDRTDSTLINTAMMWVGANMTIPSFAVGILGPAVFKLSLYDSFITIIIFNMLGIIPVAAVACFGPASGLRTMVFSRYSWGYYGASFVAFVNVIFALGWAAINSITGAQALRVVFNDKLPIAVGIIIIAFLSMVVAFAGYNWIHMYERYSWIPIFIGYCIVAGVSVKYITHSQMASVNVTTSNNISNWNISGMLSFGASCLGVSISWCSFAADYNTYFPEETKQLEIFFLTYLGNFLSIIPLQLLGAVVYTGTYTNTQWARAYEMNNAGGLLGASISSLGDFGKFLLILFSLSTVACVIPNLYSLSISSHVIAPIFKRIPRILYTIIGTIIYVILGVIVANSFASSLTSFMNVISYSFSIFIVVVFEEHFIFRRCSYQNYDFEIWNNSKLLPISIAAIFSGLIGFVGIVLGMSNTWYQGPIARALTINNDKHYPDLGFEFGFVFTAITFPLFRFLELRFIKR